MRTSFSPFSLMPGLHALRQRGRGRAGCWQEQVPEPLGQRGGSLRAHQCGVFNASVSSAHAQVRLRRVRLAAGRSAASMLQHMAGESRRLQSSGRAGTLEDDIWHRLSGLDRAAGRCARPPTAGAAAHQMPAETAQDRRARRPPTAAGKLWSIITRFLILSARLCARKLRSSGRMAERCAAIEFVGCGQVAECAAQRSREREDVKWIWQGAVGAACARRAIELQGRANSGRRAGGRPVTGRQKEPQTRPAPHRGHTALKRRAAPEFD